MTDKREQCKSCKMECPENIFQTKLNKGKIPFDECFDFIPKQSNADRIRAMSDEEMANAMFAVRIDDSKEIPYCKNLKRCEELLDTEDGIPLEMCKQCLLEWLQSEVGKTGG